MDSLSLLKDAPPVTLSEVAANEPAQRGYAEILQDAQALSPESEPQKVEQLAIEAHTRGPVERDRLFDLLKRQTGINLGTLREVGRGERSGEPDHLDLARQVLAEIGSENLLAAGPFVYQWQPRGVWRAIEDRATKQLVQGSLEGKAAVTANTVANVADVLKTDVFRSEHEFNRGNPESVNCLSGVLTRNPESGEWDLAPHSRGEYRTTQIPVAYDPGATAPRFGQFLHEVFEPDPDHEEKFRAVLEMLGYTLMSHCRHERFIMLIGGGSNGKSVLLAVTEALLGAENVAGVQPSQFDNRFQRAHLHMKLANIVTEIREGEVIADAALKGIVSGEPATVEHKFKDPFVVRPYATCWFGTNHMPHTRDFSDALFRRALIIRFSRRFCTSLGDADPMLKDKLIEELPGILNMALHAYGRALDHGFTDPASSQQAKAEWRLEADQVAQFVEDACIRTPAGEVGSQLLYDAFKEWAAGQGISKTVGQRSFVDRLERLGFGRRRGSGRNYITGIDHTKTPQVGY